LRIIINQPKVVGFSPAFATTFLALALAPNWQTTSGIIFSVYAKQAELTSFRPHLTKNKERKTRRLKSGRDLREKYVYA
jgi:hypothetical protein